MIPTAFTQRDQFSIFSCKQRLLKALSPSHGRGLIYVWAIEQDELSKRSIPLEQSSQDGGQDVMVPWVLKPVQQSTKKTGTKSESKSLVPRETAGPGPSPANNQEQEKIFNRYYHMFAKGELRRLVCEAAEQIGLSIGTKAQNAEHQRGLEIVQDGWERSNYYVELRLWSH